MSASAQKRSSSSARAAAAEGASRCDTAFTPAEKSATVRLKLSISSSATGPRRLASCNPTRSSRQLAFGELSIGCHCSSTMPSTFTGVAWLASAESSGSSWSRVTGSSARITATVSMRLDMPAVGDTPASRSAFTGSGGASRAVSMAAARSSSVMRSSDRLPTVPIVGSRRSGDSNNASPGRSPKSRSALPRARRSWTVL
jgi:hypothetical protein